MTVSGKRWKPNHDTVVLKLPNQKKLGFKKVDEKSGIRVVIGPGQEGQLDLVVALAYRTRGKLRGNAHILFEVKTEHSGLLPTVWKALQQLDMYRWALEDPDLFTVKESDKAWLSNSLAYRKYIVIQKALWEEEKGLSERDQEKLLTLLDRYCVGIITYDEKWRFSLEKRYPLADEQHTEHLGKTVTKKVRAKKVAKKK